MDLSLRLLGEDNASAAFTSVAAAARQGLGLVIDFTKESVKAFLDAEAAEKRMALAAKGLTDVMKEQASTFQSTLGVADDVTMSIQTMLLQFGEAPGQVEATTKAILDFSAATGQDATAAASQLISSVETGRNAFKEYGIQLGSTGKASADMVTATKALAAQFGGSADAQAQTLTGQLHIASEAFEDLKKSFGGAIATFLQDSGVIKDVTTYIKELSNAVAQLQYDGEQPQSGRNSNNYQAIGLIRGNGSQFKPGSKASKVDRETFFGKKMREKRESEAPTDAQKEASLRELIDADQKETDAFIRQGEAVTAANKKTEEEAKRHAKEMQRTVDKQMKDAEKKKAEAEMAGASIGAAFVNGLSSQIDKLASGQEMDVGETLVSIIGGALSLVGGLLGTMLGGPAGATFGASLGGLASSGLRAAVGAGRGRHHIGGWVGAPRMHSGQWVGLDEYPAILQGGERVLSRSEVGRMGGSGAVDAAAMGGGGGRPAVVVNVSSIDARSTREFFEKDGGRGLFNAVRTGRGDMARLLGGGR